MQQQFSLLKKQKKLKLIFQMELLGYEPFYQMRFVTLMIRLISHIGYY